MTVPPAGQRPSASRKQMLERLRGRAPLASDVAGGACGENRRGECAAAKSAVASRQASRSSVAATRRSRLAARAVGHQRRHGLGDRQRFLRRFQQPAAALGDVVGIFLVARIAQRPVQLAQHQLREPDHGIERGAQLVAHLGHQLAQARCRCRGWSLSGAWPRLPLPAGSASAAATPCPSPSGRPGASPAAPPIGPPAAAAGSCQAVVTRMAETGQVERGCQPALAGPAAQCRQRAARALPISCSAAVQRMDGVPRGWGDVPGVIPVPRPNCMKCCPERIRRRNKPHESHQSLCSEPQSLVEVAKRPRGEIMAAVSDTRVSTPASWTTISNTSATAAWPWRCAAASSWRLRRRSASSAFQLRKA